MLGTSVGSYGQFIVVLLIFLGVLAVTFYVTKWTAGYQKKRSSGANIELIDSAPLAANKHIQIVRVGNKYVALAVCKDTVTKVADLEENDLVLAGKENTGMSFRDILSRAGKSSGEDETCSDENVTHSNEDENL